MLNNFLLSKFIVKLKRVFSSVVIVQFPCNWLDVVRHPRLRAIVDTILLGLYLSARSFMLKCLRLLSDQSNCWRHMFPRLGREPHFLIELIFRLECLFQKCLQLRLQNLSFM